MLKYGISNWLTTMFLYALAPIARWRTREETVAEVYHEIRSPAFDGEVSEKSLENRREAIFLQVLGPFLLMASMLLLLLLLGVVMWIFFPPGPPGMFIQIVIQIILWVASVSIGLINVLLIKQTIAWFQKWRFVRMEPSKQSSYRPSRVSHPVNWDLLFAIPFAYFWVSLSNGWWPWI